MSKSLARSIVSAVLAACFALSVVSLDAMPGCATASAGQPAAVHGHSNHDHSNGAPLSGAARCVVHLCCAHLATTVVGIQPVDRALVVHRTIGFAAAAS